MDAAATFGRAMGPAESVTLSGVPDFPAFAYSLWVLLRDTLKRWLSWISAGLASLLSWITYAGNVPPPARPIAYAAAAILFLWAFAWTFHLLRVERDALLEDRKPKFDIVFAPANEVDSRPYLQTLEFESILAMAAQGRVTLTRSDRRFRVGIISLSSVIVPDVSLKLESCTPGGNFVHVGHNVMVTDSSPRARGRDLPPSVDGMPTLFFDVINELGDKGTNPDHFTFCYSNEAIEGPIPAGTYEIVLKAEGGGVSAAKRFRITKSWSPTDGYGKLTMAAM